MPDRWEAVAALVDPSRRALFDYVRRQNHPVGREEAAAATGMARGLAAFHLDKLVETGLLVARYEAPAGPRGRGRTPKVYAAAAAGLTITIPERRDDLVADILAEAFRRHEPPDRVAAEHGRAYAVHELANLGFEPRPEGDVILLGNCPFHELAARHGALICDLALAFVTGMSGASSGYEAIPAPVPGGCCVALRRSVPA